MEIQSRQAGEPLRSFEEKQRALIDANRARVRAAREHLSAIAGEQLARLRESRERALEAAAGRSAPAEARDALELSEAALAAHEAPAPAEREARVRELAEAHRLERLHTPERIERAAQRLLQG
jgi:hypothetical protein